jgi:hypothetical protein
MRDDNGDDNSIVRRMESSSSNKNPDKKVSSDGPFYCHDLLEPHQDAATPSLPAQEQAMAAAQGQAQWIEAFWFSSQRRKHPSLTFSIKKDSWVCIQRSKDTQEQEDFERYWKKQIETALKKIHVEDLGAMNAMELKDSIPIEDSEGRGRKDLEVLEKQLSVKVVFGDNEHVLLVGQKQKLQKKCFVMRNILSHYHWRLSGKDVSLS